jgi:hypothetical protein
MKSFDAFGKPIDEFQVKTACGGYLSICSLILIFMLFMTELKFFLELETKDEMLIDQNQDRKYLDLIMNISFPQIPCSVLYVNLVDAKKANVMHVQHELYKQRLDSRGQPFGKRIRDGLRDVAASSGELSQSILYGQQERKQAHSSARLRCGSCYQSHIDEDDCCATCDEVKEAYSQRSWNFPTDYVFEQCEDTAYNEASVKDVEGCRIEGTMHVRKVNACIQLGIGRFFKHDYVPKPFAESAGKGTLNFSHTISHLAFGADFPGLSHVLDGRVKEHHDGVGTEHFQYDIHVIPTIYSPSSGDDISSHQYSVTEYVKTISPRERQAELVSAGLFFSYDFTPFEVKVTVRRKALSHFLTECCAIMGGIFAFTGMLDNFSYRLSKFIARRARGGTPSGAGLSAQ